MFEHVLVAIDFSPAWSRLRDRFLALQFQRRLALRVIRAGADSEGERATAEQELAALSQQVGALEILIESGDPRRVVSGQAGSLPADLTVLGKRGRSTISELLLGSTAEAVCHRAQRPVLLVPGPEA